MKIFKYDYSEILSHFSLYIVVTILAIRIVFRSPFNFLCRDFGCYFSIGAAFVHGKKSIKG